MLLTAQMGGEVTESSSKNRQKTLLSRVRLRLSPGEREREREREREYTTQPPSLPTLLRDAFPFQFPSPLRATQQRTALAQPSPAQRDLSGPLVSAAATEPASLGWGLWKGKKTKWLTKGYVFNRPGKLSLCFSSAGADSIHFLPSVHFLLSAGKRRALDLWHPTSTLTSNPQRCTGHSLAPGSRRRGKPEHHGRILPELVLSTSPRGGAEGCQGRKCGFHLMPIRA